MVKYEKGTIYRDPDCQGVTMSGIISLSCCLASDEVVIGQQSSNYYS